MTTNDLYATAMEIHMLSAVVKKKTIQALERRLDLADIGVSGLQFGIMHALSRRERTISELSQRFMLDPSTLVPAVDALERKGLARRGRDPNDRRRIPISLTERGAELAACVPMVDEDDPLVYGLDLMGDEQCQQFLALFRELVRHLPEGEDILAKVSSRIPSQLERESMLT
jgi:DNA-binding MarR family transcriptional regulator